MPDDDAKAQRDREIDAQLKHVFQVLLEQELPERLTDLLDRLREAEAQGGGLVAGRPGPEGSGE